jgi:hypothetical protein
MDASRLRSPVDQHAPGLAGWFLGHHVSCADRDLIVPKTDHVAPASPLARLRRAGC